MHLYKQYFAQGKHAL